jgi:hypothetical protein
MGPPPDYHANILEKFFSASILTQASQHDTERPILPRKAVFPVCQDNRSGGAPGAARASLSRRDKGENDLEFLFARANTHLRQNFMLNYR